MSDHVRFVGLLRGINVGGKNRVAMADLREIFAAAGAASPSTYIASGNVLFEAPPEAVPALGAEVSRVLAEAGVRTHVVFRSAAELAAVVRRRPFPGVAEGKLLHVVFLADEPAPERVAALDPARSPPDEARVVGRELWLSTPNGVGNTRYTQDYLDRTLGTRGTARNWKTVLALHDLLR